MSLIAEAFVFSYIGLTFFSYGKYAWSPDLIIAEIFIVIFGRAFSTIGFYSLLNLCGYEKKNPLSWKELIFIWYAGMIRGAIAFGLVLQIEPANSINRDVIVTTCLSLVVLTTVIFGSTVGYLGHAFFDEKKEEKVKDENEVSAIMELKSEESKESEDEDELHPNFADADVTDNASVSRASIKEQKGGCVRWFRR